MAGAESVAGSTRGEECLQGSAEPWLKTERPRHWWQKTIAADTCWQNPTWAPFQPQFKAVDLKWYSLGQNLSHCRFLLNQRLWKLRANIYLKMSQLWISVVPYLLISGGNLEQLLLHCVFWIPIWKSTFIPTNSQYDFSLLMSLQIPIKQMTGSLAFSMSAKVECMCKDCDNTLLGWKMKIQVWVSDKTSTLKESFNSNV